ncbi:hypothetical protein CALCODRAFT_315179 [Calocera cornea HHB12733]|uniref:Uncharacterized protein n=1 Tax=Calocera cornea HHB12733 TaxID=1353952 RepID=A0A165FCG6_9BASI|nr:hypothetical protein CALCODRAFT_315179 [Calocera cornea HHB12733]
MLTPFVHPASHLLRAATYIPANRTSPSSTEPSYAFSSHRPQAPTLPSASPHPPASAIHPNPRTCSILSRFLPRLMLVVRSTQKCHLPPHAALNG